MILSNTTEYGIRLLTLIARESGSFCSAKTLIDKLKISDKYARRLLTQLTKAGFVTSMHGRDGGYMLAKPASEIRILDIIKIFEAENKIFNCVLGFSECSNDSPCAMHAAWLPVRDKMLDTFSNNSLAQVASTTFLKI